MNVVILFPHLPEPEEELLTYKRAVREQHLVKTMQENGFDASLYLLSHKESPFVLEDRPEKPCFFPIDRDSRKKGRKRYTSAALCKALKDQKPDCVILKGLGYYLPYSLYRAGVLPASFGFIVGGNEDDIMLPYASFVYAEFASQLRAAFLPLNKQKRCTQLSKLIPQEDFRQNKTKQADIISVGDLSYRKNHKALLPLAKQHSCTLVGDGPLNTEIKELSRGTQLNLTGGLAKEKVSERIASARIMVHPSRSEGFPRVFAEAFACGVPVLALKRAIRGEFPDGVAGELVEEDKLLERAEAILNDPELLAFYSRGARKLAEESYSPDVVYKQFCFGLEALKAPKEPKLYRLKHGIHLKLRYGLWFTDYLLYRYIAPIKRALWAYMSKQKRNILK